MFFFFLLNILPILLAVMFFTLMEVQMLGKIHLRLGPTRVGMIGIFQPLSDFLKLFNKSFWFPQKSNLSIYFISPLLCLFVGFIVWHGYGTKFPLTNIKWSILSFFCLSSLLVFYLLMSGWASSSTYSLLGSYRSAAQTISYEVCLIFIIFSSIFFVKTFSIWELSEETPMLSLIHPILLLIWIFSCLAESNRTPFDLTEGESELVSGFNTEFQGGLLSFFFITEYAFMIFLSFLTIIFFMNQEMFWLKQMLMISFFIFTRSAYPRMRFDWLMKIMWKNILPIILSSLVLSTLI
uniref:NADH-ubiquinone oxidoreductase chain 1 n=1 Tax=Leptotrombidium pallidum TaxID=279272 RepID=Q4W8E1_9ACAR|nr:NADH dehydrogenase subunit 1 [Leptotrombidium pallidum]BAD99498.1 NADH dehydrogenase subunit 1 [Leptotrombidium pallidum]